MIISYYEISIIGVIGGVSGKFPPRKIAPQIIAPWIVAPGMIGLWITAPRTIVPCHNFASPDNCPLDKCPREKLPHLDKCPLDDCYHQAGTVTLSQRCDTVESESWADIGFRRCDNIALWRYQDAATKLLQRRDNIYHCISRPFYCRLFWFLSLHRIVRELSGK